MSERREVVWTPTVRQAEFLACPHDEVLYGGAAGAGKSDALLMDALGMTQGAILKPRYRALIVRRTFPQLRELIDRSRVLYPIVDRAAHFHEQSREWRFPSGAKVLFGYLGRNADVYQYQGQEFQWIGFDELTHWDSPLAWEYLWTRLRSSDPDLRCYMRGTTNPGGVGHQWVKDRWVIANDGRSTFQEIAAGERSVRRAFISARLADNPHLLRTGYGERLLLLPEQERRHLLDGRWDIDEDLRTLISAAGVRAARDNQIRDSLGPRLLGVDPARFGDDRTAICFRQGRRTWWVRTRTGQDLMTTCGDVVRYILDLGIDKAFLDVCGLGAGLYDRLVEMGYGELVVPVNSAERALEAERYANKRAEMWAELRDWLQGDVQIPDDDALQADLTGPRYGYDSNGRLKLEKKEELKKRGLRSPDLADALALTFAFPVGPSLAEPMFEESSFRPMDGGFGY